MILTKKQTLALDLLEDDVTEELFYGGAAGGAKSSLGCYFQLKRRYKYPGSRGLIGRESFKTLKETTLKTFFEIAAFQGLKRGRNYELTGPWDKENPNCILFDNSSMIYLKDLGYYPGDENYDELGSLEITDAFVDEAGQIRQLAKDTLKVRIRYGLNKWNLIPKLLMAGNPSKHWPYLEFYRSDKEGRLPQHKKFLQAFAWDNPHNSAAYLRSLQNMPEGPQKERMWYGNWEYNDDPSALIAYEKIIDVFTNRFVEGGEKFLTVDVARFGKDSSVFGVWDGWRVKLFKRHGLDIKQVAAFARELQRQYSIPNSNTLVDEDGVGGGVVDILGCKGFVNNSRPLPNPTQPQRDEKGNELPENYDNLRSQCSFRMADRISKGGLFVELENPQDQQLVIEEMEQVKQKFVDSDKKKGIIPKEDIKSVIGRSPDYWDAIMMKEKFALSFHFRVAVA